MRDSRCKGVEMEVSLVFLGREKEGRMVGVQWQRYKQSQMDLRVERVVGLRWVWKVVVKVQIFFFWFSGKFCNVLSKLVYLIYNFKEYFYSCLEDRLQWGKIQGD